MPEVDSTRPRVDVVYIEAGSGHRTAALGLASTLMERGVDARAVDMLDVVAAHSRLRRFAGTGVDYYNWWLRRAQVWDLKGLINLGLLAQDLVGARGTRLVAQYWSEAPPAAVVSVIPIYNEMLARAFRLANPSGRYFIVPVDFEEGKKRYWFDRKTVGAEYLLTGDQQRSQALAAGIEESALVDLPGMIADPRFYEPPSQPRDATLTGLGLDPDLPTVLIAFGGQGSVLVERCLKRLEAVQRALNVIALCGRSDPLRRRLSGLSTRHRLAALGFKPRPALYYHAADVVIGKSGTMTVVESAITGTPLLAIRSRGLRVIQGGNERWVEREGLGKIVPGPEHLPDALERVLADPGYEERLAAARHRSIFRAAEIIADAANGRESSTQRSVDPPGQRTRGG